MTRAALPLTRALATALCLAALGACARQPEPPVATGTIADDDRPGILAPNEALCREPGAPLSCAGTGEGGVPADRAPR